jgi:hypothetical protein
MRGRWKRSCEDARKLRAYRRAMARTCIRRYRRRCAPIGKARRPVTGGLAGPLISFFWRRRSSACGRKFDPRLATSTSRVARGADTCVRTCAGIPAHVAGVAAYVKDRQPGRQAWRRHGGRFAPQRVTRFAGVSQLFAPSDRPPSARPQGAFLATRRRHPCLLATPASPGAITPSSCIDVERRARGEEILPFASACAAGSASCPRRS